MLCAHKPATDASLAWPVVLFSFRGVYRGRVTEETSLERASGSPPRASQGEAAAVDHLHAVPPAPPRSSRLPELRHVSWSAGAEGEERRRIGRGAAQRFTRAEPPTPGATRATERM